MTQSSVTDLDAEARADVLREYRAVLSATSSSASRYFVMRSIGLDWANSYMHGVDVGLRPDAPCQLADLARWRVAREYCAKITTKIIQRHRRRDSA